MFKALFLVLWLDRKMNRSVSSLQKSDNGRCDERIKHYKVMVREAQVSLSR